MSARANVDGVGAQDTLAWSVHSKYHFASEVLAT